MGTKSFFKNQTGLPPDSKGAISKNLTGSLADVESHFHVREYAEEQSYLLPDVDYSDLSKHVRYGLAYDYYNNAFKRIRTQYPYDGSAAEKLEFYNNLTPFEKYIFDELYPKYNGYVTFGLGTYGGDTAANFGTTTNPQYVRFYGGPHEDNIIDSDVKQENNLHLNLNDGFTVEFWLKKNGWASDSTQTVLESIVNIRNTADSQRFFLYLNRGAGLNNIIVYQEYFDGSWKVMNSATIDSGVTDIADNTWRHFAFTFKKEGSSVESLAYVNGNHVDTQAHTPGGSVYTITGSVVGTLAGAGGVNHGAAINTAAVDSQAGYGKPLSASFDDFRVWKTKRSAKQIGLNWFRNVDGGTNSDTSKYYYKTDTENNKVDLAVYFKFNEGVSAVSGSGTYDPGNEVTSSTSIGDNLVVDYSGRISNGVFIGYNSSLSMRSTDSAMVLAGAVPSEEKDPLLFDDNPNYDSTLNSLLTSGSNHDVTNPTSFYNNIPQWMRDQDSFNGTEIKKLFQVIGSYFDTIHAQVEHVKKFKEPQYISSSNKTTDYSAKLLKASGFNVPEMFVDPEILATIFDQDEKRIFSDKLYNLKNKVYKNIYANLTTILKSKGTEKSFRNLFRCYGVDDELFKINLYADGVEYQIDDKTYDSLVKKRLVDFSGFENSEDREGVILQKTSTAGMYGYYSTASNVDIPMTVEAQILFPRKPDIPSLDSLQPLPTASLFGVHSSSLSHSETTIPAGGDCDFQVQTRRSVDSNFAQFVLTSSTGFFPVLTSSFFKDEDKLIYDNIPWNIAVRLYPSEYPFSNYVTQSQNFTLNFYGIKTHLGETLAEFDVSEEITRGKAGQFITGSNKRFFIGAHKTNITGSVLEKSDVKFSRFMVWNSYLTNDEITKHSRNPKNYGLSKPHERAFTFESSAISASYIPKADTLALNWEFDTVTSASDVILDSTSGSTSLDSQYPVDGFSLYNNQNYPASASGFSTSGDFTKLDFMHGNIIHRPDSLYGKNMTRLLANDHDPYQINKKPVKFFFAFEASKNEVISRDMLNFFADVVSFNNLYGEAVHAYRDKYKQLEFFKSFYFSKVDSVENLDKFVNLYKFLDEALDGVLHNLVPASAATSEKIRTIVEDHVLDRHKVKRPYEKLIQSFPKDIKSTNKISGNESKHVPQTKDLDTNNVDLDQIKLTSINDTSLTVGNTHDEHEFTRNSNYPVAPIKTFDRIPKYGRASNNLINRAAKTRANEAMLRTREVARIPDPDGDITLGYVGSVTRAEKDRASDGYTLVGSTDVDSFRTQLDLYSKYEQASVLSSPANLVTAEVITDYKPRVKSQNMLGETNRFSDTSLDGITIELLDQNAFLIDDIEDSVYGRMYRRTKATVRDSDSDNYGIFKGESVLDPINVKILSSSAMPFDSGVGFEVIHTKESELSSIAIKTLNSQLFKGREDRDEPFSINTLVTSPGDPPQILINNPQITSDNASTLTHNTNIPTNLVSEKKLHYCTKLISGFNWDGKSAAVFGISPRDWDTRTYNASGNVFSYSSEPSKDSMFEESDGATPVYDRILITRVQSTSSNAFIRTIDRSIPQDRYDLESLQYSPNQNLNYRDLNLKKSLQRAFSTPLANGGTNYRTIGRGPGVSIYSSPSNSRLMIDPVHGQSFRVKYDNGYVFRGGQNDYDTRWFRKVNIVRLGINGAPYKNTNFSTLAADVGGLINYAPLTESLYKGDDLFTMPNSEEVAGTGVHTRSVDFHGTNFVVNREIDLNTRTIDPTANHYISPDLPSAPSDHMALNLYLLNANGPYQYSLEAARLRYAATLLNSSTFRNTFYFETSETLGQDDVVQPVSISPVSFKTISNTAILEKDQSLHKINYSVTYPHFSEYFHSDSLTFRKLPKKFHNDVLKMKHNQRYNCIFSENSQATNNFSLKYFDFAEYIFPRRQFSFRNLDDYETEVNFVQNTDQRKIYLSENTLGRSFPATSNYVNCLFSSWPLETFIIERNYGTSITVHDGELMQINHDAAYNVWANIGLGSCPYAANYYNITLGYKINAFNRPDSVSPRSHIRRPFKSFREHIGSDLTADVGKALLVEYRRDDTIDDYMSGQDVASLLTLFGHSTSGKQLLGHASYTDEIFELKDIHKQIDKF